MLHIQSLNRMQGRLESQASLKSRPGRMLKRSERIKRKSNPSGRKTQSGSHLSGRQKQDLRCP